MKRQTTTVTIEETDAKSVPTSFFINCDKQIRIVTNEECSFIFTGDNIIWFEINNPSHGHLRFIADCNNCEFEMFKIVCNFLAVSVVDLAPYAQYC